MSISAEDHVAIERLMYRYAQCADAKDYAGFAGVFTADAQFDYLGQAFVSLPAIQQMMRNLDRFSVTQHFVHNVLYEVNGDQAQGRTYCLACHLQEMPGEVVTGEVVKRDVIKIDMGIAYDDLVMRTTDGWRIHRRSFNPLWTHTTPTDGP